MDWYDDDRLWTVFDAYIFSPERMKAADGEAEQLLALAGVPPGDALDLCCGPGRHAVAFARRGFRVTGVDRSGRLLAQARTHARDRGLEVEFVQQDMRAFVRPAHFDLVVNLFTSFGYFDDDEDQLRVLRNVFESLRPGGTFLIELMGKEVLARIYQPTLSTMAADGTLVVARVEIVGGWTRARNEWIAIKDGTALTFTLEHWVYSGRELRQMLETVGFVHVRLHGDLGGGEYDAHATRLIAVARKPPAHMARR